MVLHEQEHCTQMEYLFSQNEKAVTKITLYKCQEH